MKLTPITPNQSINKAYRKEKVSRSDIELFKRNLKEFLASINEKESEEHVKNNHPTFRGYKLNHLAFLDFVSGVGI